MVPANAAPVEPATCGAGSEGKFPLVPLIQGGAKTTKVEVVIN